MLRYLTVLVLSSLKNVALSFFCFFFHERLRKFRVLQTCPCTHGLALNRAYSCTGIDEEKNLVLLQRNIARLGQYIMTGS